MPFSSGFSIGINNTCTYGIVVYMQVFYTLKPVTTPLRLHGYGYQIPTTLTYPNEYSWLSQTGPNGVYLAAVKFFFAGNTATVSTNTFEGRFKFYGGGTGMPLGSSISGNHYTSALGGNQVPTPYQAGATVLNWSSGTEDYFLGSYDWASMGGATAGAAGTTLTKRGGLAFNGATPTANYNWTCFRFYDAATGFVGSAPGQYLVGTWSPGDVVTGQAGSLTNLDAAFVLYYA